MKKYQKAKILLERKAQNINKKPIYATRKLSIGLVSCMLGLVMAVPVAHAEEFDMSSIDSIIESLEDEPSPDDSSTNDSNDLEDILTYDEIQAIRDRANSLENDYFFNDNMVEELKAELRKAKADPSVNYEQAKARLIDEAIQKNAPAQKAPGEVRATVKVKAPSIDPVFYDATTISGANLAKDKVKVGKKKVTVIATVHVTLKGEDGTVKAELSVTPTSGTTWKVDLPQGVKVTKGDTVTVYQQIGEDKSPEVNATAQASKAASVTLTMPSGKIWLEQFNSNIVNADEKAEALELMEKYEEN